MKRILRILTIALAAVCMFILTVSAGLAESTTPVYSAEDLFTDRDLEQTADRTDAVFLTVADGQDITITEAGVYVLSGTASGVTVRVEAGEDDKVQLVLDGLSVTNTSFPVIYVKSADKVFVTVAADSSLAVTGAFTSDGDTKTDAVIFSKDDLVLNGTGTLNIKCAEANGISGRMI